MQKRREMMPGQNGSERRWDAGALQMAWDVETRSPDLKSMAHILIQSLRLHTAQPNSRSEHPDLVRTGQTR